MVWRRRWFGFGKLPSEEGFTLSYAHRSVTYSDARGIFQFGFEDGFVFPSALQTAGVPIELSSLELEEILGRVIEAMHADGLPMQVYRGQ